MVNVSISNSTGLLNHVKIPLDTPFETEKEVNLELVDIFSQSSFAELIEERYQQTTNYIIAIASDVMGHISLMDGCSFVSQYYVHGKTQSALTRRNIKSVAFYALPIATADEVKVALDAKQPPKDAPQLNCSSNLKKISSSSLSVLGKMQFKYICNIHDLIRKSTKDLFLSFIAAHDLNLQERASQAFKIAIIYQVGADHPDYNITDKVAKFFFQKNEGQAFYWHLQAAKLDCADSFYHLSHFCDVGEGCQASAVEAFHYMEKAVELDPNSINYLKVLAYRYYKGLGTTPNKEKAGEILNKINTINAIKDERRNFSA